jgi:hypothetical protein
MAHGLLSSCQSETWWRAMVGSRIDRDAVGSMQDATVAVAIALSCGCGRRIGWRRDGAGRGRWLKLRPGGGLLAVVGTWRRMDTYG